MDKTSLIKGHLEMCVLAILAKQKNYGYELMKELETHNLELKGIGSIYPILTKLKTQGWVETDRVFTESGRARVYYEINEQGKERLQKKIEEWLELQNDISSLLVENGWEGVNENER